MKFVAKKSDNEGASKSSIAKQNMAFWDGETIRMSVWYFIEGGDIRKNLNFTKEALIKNQPLVELLIKVGEKHQATPGQVALAWLSGLFRAVCLKRGLMV